MTIRGKANGQVLVKTGEQEKEACVIPVKVNKEEWEEIEGSFLVKGERCGLFLEFVGEGSFDLLQLEFL